MTRDNPAERHFETTGGATIERSGRAEPAPSEARVLDASQRIRVQRQRQRQGEPEFVLREGVLYTVGGIQVTAEQQPDWARNSIMTAALAIRRHEFINAKIRARNPQNEEI